MSSDGAATAAAVPAPVAAASEATTHAPLIILLDYRAAIESVDLDEANEAAWKEALDGFGYQHLDQQTFLQDLALCTSSEVMMALCPYTTKNEWEPALNKRDLRLAREVDEMCYANAVPVPGVLDLITNASKLRRAVVVLLSPFREDITRQLLDVSTLAGVVDAVVCYTSLDVAALEALAHLKCPPKTYPDKLASTVSEMFTQPDPDLEGAEVVAFVSTATSARKMRAYGIVTVGVLHNSCDQEETAEDDEDFTVLPGRDGAESMRAAGAILSVLNYTYITPQHLEVLRQAQRR